MVGNGKLPAYAVLVDTSLARVTTQVIEIRNRLHRIMLLAVQTGINLLSIPLLLAQLGLSLLLVPLHAVQLGAGHLEEAATSADDGVAHALSGQQHEQLGQVPNRTFQQPPEHYRRDELIQPARSAL